jgi:ribosomal protein S18 acetylase RimI-like enzyme
LRQVAFRILDAMAARTQRTRVAGPTDAEEVAELLDRFQVEFDEQTPGARVLTGRVRDHIGHNLSVFVLAGPPKVGVAQLRFREWLLTGEPICYLEELYVVPDRRGEGHGRALMERAMGVARERGATTIELTTSATDTAARALYERLGFTNLERARDPETQMLYYEREL